MKIIFYFLFLAITLIMPLSYLAFGAAGNIFTKIIFFVFLIAYIVLLVLVIKKKKENKQ